MRRKLGPQTLGPNPRAKPGLVVDGPTCANWLERSGAQIMATPRNPTRDAKANESMGACGVGSARKYKPKEATAATTRIGHMRGHHSTQRQVGGGRTCRTGANRHIAGRNTSGIARLWRNEACACLLMCLACLAARARGSPTHCWTGCPRSPASRLARASLATDAPHDAPTPIAAANDTEMAKHPRNTRSCSAY